MAELSWYPGHMVKARRVVRENIKLVDVVLEILDARIPSSSRNPDIVNICGRAPRLVVLNKADLADAGLTSIWEKLISEQGTPVVSVNATVKKTLKNIPEIVRKLAESKMANITARGRRTRAVRCLLVGIPNVGKSSIINSLAGRKVTRVESRPGVTRGKQWVKVDSHMELLDTPGILYPKIDDPVAVMKLIVTGALEAGEQEAEKAALWLVEYLSVENPDVLSERYKLKAVKGRPLSSVLKEIGQKRGLLASGGKVQLNLVARLILKEYQNGLLGNTTLDVPL